MDEWNALGPRINDPETIRALRKIVDDESDVIVEHRHYRGSRSPTRCVFSIADELEKYLTTQLRPGDSILIWKFETCCTGENIAWSGKFPDAGGNSPVGGAY